MKKYALPILAVLTIFMGGLASLSAADDDFGSRVDRAVKAQASRAHAALAADKTAISSAAELDAAYVEGLRAIILRSTPMVFGRRTQLEAVENIAAIFRKPATSPELRTRIIDIFLIEAAQAHGLDPLVPQKTIETAGALYCSSTPVVQKQIVDRLGGILNNKIGGLGRVYAEPVLNNLSKGCS